MLTDSGDSSLESWQLRKITEEEPSSDRTSMDRFAFSRLRFDGGSGSVGRGDRHGV